MVGTHRLKKMEKYVPLYLEMVAMVTKLLSVLERNKDRLEELSPPTFEDV